MSSMLRTTFASALAIMAFQAAPALAQAAHPDGMEWDHARNALQAQPAGDMHLAVERWRLLTASGNFTFGDFSNFLLTYPGMPEEAKLRGFAEKALERESVPAQQVVGFFDRYPPLSNTGRGQPNAA